MRKSMVRETRKAVKALKAMLIPGLAMLLAMLPAVVVSMVMPTPVHGAIDQRGMATTGTTINATLTIDKPSGVVAGDVMIVNIAKCGNTAEPSSTGWTLIAGANLGGGIPKYGAVLYRVADGTEGAGFSFELGAGTDAAVGSIVAFSGVDTSGATPFDVAPGTISVQNLPTVAATAITTASADAAVIMFGMAAASAPSFFGWTTTSPGALTELYDREVSSANSASVGAAWAVKPAAGDTGVGVATLLFSERNGGILIALRPAVSTALTVNPAAGIYGGTASLTATLTPAVAGKTISFTLNGAAAGTAVTDTTGAANIPAADLSGISCGTYPSGVGASFEGDVGFSASGSTADLTVKPREVTVTADDKSKVYGDADPALTYRISSGSLTGSDAFAGNVARAAGEKAGTYAIQRGTLALGSNYNLTFVDGTLTISARNIEVTADDKSKVNGDADPALTCHISSGSLVAGDAFSGQLVREAGEDVGAYAIRRGTVALSNSYNLTFVDGVFTIRSSDAEAPSAPTVDGISPQSGRPGDTMDVVIRGSDFTGTTKVDFGPGVTVNSFAVENPTRIVANVTIDPAAELGDNNIVVSTPAGDGQFPGAFSISLSAAPAKARGLLLILLLVLLAAGLGFILYAWLKRRNRLASAPELAPIVAPSRPPGGARQAVDPSWSPEASMDLPLGEAATLANLEQTLAATADQPVVSAETLAESEQAPAMATDQPLGSTEERAADSEEAPAPAMATEEPIEEAEKPSGLPQAVVPAAAAPKPRKRATRKAPASAPGRARTPAKKRKKATG